MRWPIPDCLYLLLPRAISGGDRRAFDATARAGRHRAARLSQLGPLSVNSIDCRTSLRDRPQYDRSLRRTQTGRYFGTVRGTRPMVSQLTPAPTFLESNPVISHRSPSVRISPHHGAPPEGVMWGPGASRLTRASAAATCDAGAGDAVVAGARLRPRTTQGVGRQRTKLAPRASGGPAVNSRELTRQARCQPRQSGDRWPHAHRRGPRGRRRRA